MISQTKFSDFIGLKETFILHMYFISQKLGNDTEVGLLQVLEAWELFVEILSQVEYFLGHIEDLVFSHSANLD